MKKSMKYAVISMMAAGLLAGCGHTGGAGSSAGSNSGSATSNVTQAPPAITGGLEGASTGSILAGAGGLHSTGGVLLGPNDMAGVTQPGDRVFRDDPSRP